MTELPLNGLRVLIVEDDYYLASDTMAVIMAAGGKVVGPFGTADEARTSLNEDGADIAIVDINLGNGPAFGLARHLKESNVPFLFATGYDQAVVPDDLSAIIRLEKPFRPAELISAAASVHQSESTRER